MWVAKKNLPIAALVQCKDNISGCLPASKPTACGWTCLCLRMHICINGMSRHKTTGDTWKRPIVLSKHRTQCAVKSRVDWLAFHIVPLKKTDINESLSSRCNIPPQVVVMASEALQHTGCTDLILRLQTWHFPFPAGWGGRVPQDRMYRMQICTRLVLTRTRQKKENLYL